MSAAVPVRTTAASLDDVVANGNKIPSALMPASVLAAANNLSDIASASTARTNLGLGTIATHPTTDFLALNGDQQVNGSIIFAQSILGNISGNAASISGSISEGQVTGLTDDLSTLTTAVAAKLSPSGNGSGLTNLTPANLSSGTAGISISGNAANVSGTVAIGHGGTGTTTAAAALAAILPDQSSANGKVLGSSSGTAAWVNQTGGSGFLPIQSKSADYTLTSSDGGAMADASGGAVAITLPDASTAVGPYYVGKVDSSVNVVNVLTTSSQLINGIPGFTIRGQWSAYLFLPFGSSWLIA